MFIQPNLDLLILQARITDMIAGIIENQFENVFQELQNSITLCISNDDGLISITRTIKKTWVCFLILFADSLYHIHLQSYNYFKLYMDFMDIMYNYSQSSGSCDDKEEVNVKIYYLTH